MEVVADLVNGAMLWLGESASFVECIYAMSAGSLVRSERPLKSHTFLEEEPYFVTRLQEVLVADMVCAIFATSRELGHWMVVQ